MAQKVQTTSISNAQLKNLLKLADTCQFKTENGEWKLEKGTYHSIKKAAGHVRCEMAKQQRQTRKTMNIEVISDPERQEFQRGQFLNDIDNLER
tara:strand:- start:108 stop:389 length:282 start_codon:yes stop_codon:yes gene_type:complete